MDDKFMQEYLIQLLASQPPIEAPNLPLNYKKLFSFVDQIKQAFGTKIELEVAIYDITKPEDPASSSQELNENSLLQSFDGDQFNKVKNYLHQNAHSWKVQHLTTSEYFNVVKNNLNKVLPNKHVVISTSAQKIAP